MGTTQAGGGGGVILVRALGASEIQIGKKKITLSAELVFALALYLCTRAGERLTRDEVTEVFWGEGHDVQGRHSLRQMLYRLRQKGLTLDEEGEELYLDPARVESDLNAALRESWVASADAAAVGAAASLTPGFSRHISERFQEWYDGVRHRLAAQHRRAALRQISVARREGRWSDVDRWALEVLRSDPLNEEATLARAESAAMAGSKAMALEIIDAYMEELGDRAARIGLPATVLRRRIAERRPEWSGRGPRDVPLVGRSKLMARLTGFVEAAGRGEGSAVILWGAPGIGKTRLAEETRAFAELGGFRTVFVRATVASSTRPLSVLLSLIPLLRDLPGAAGCDPATMALLDHVVAKRAERAEHDSASAVVSLRDAVLAALQDLIEAITAECRVMAVIDDVHNADDASWELLLVLMARSSECRNVWICTSRVRHREVRQAHNAVVNSLCHINVPPLAEEEAVLLAEALNDTHRELLTSDELSAVARAAGGNPLFVRELSAHRATTAPAKDLPSSLRELMNDRLERMEPGLIRVLRVSTLLGSLASLPRVRHLYRNQSIDWPESIERLETEGILRLGPLRTLDLHECWQQSIGDGMSSATRAALALECAELLASQPTRALTTDVLWRAAELFVEAGDVPRALALFTECGKQMHNLGFPAEASTILTRALGLACDDRERSNVLLGLAHSLYSCGRLDEVIDVCSQTLSVENYAEPVNLVLSTSLLCLRMDSSTKLHRDHREDLRRLAQLVCDERLPAEVRQFACFSGSRVVFNDNISSLEDLFFTESVRVSDEHGPSVYGYLVQLIYSTERGRTKDIERIDHELALMDSESLVLPLRCMTLRYRSTALRWLGHSQQSHALAERSCALAMRSGLLGEIAGMADSMSFACLDALDLAGAALWIRKLEDTQKIVGFAARAQSLLHAQSRLLMQQGDYEKALDACLPRLSEIHRDFFAKRRAAELATIGFCAVSTGSIGLGRDAVVRSQEIVRNNRASRFMDYPAEMSLRTLVALGDKSEAEHFGSEYAKRRMALHSLPIPPFFEEVQRFVEETKS